MEYVCGKPDHQSVYDEVLCTLLSNFQCSVLNYFADDFKTHIYGDTFVMVLQGLVMCSVILGGYFQYMRLVSCYEIFNFERQLECY